MEALGIVGMSMGTLGFLFSMSALARITKLEKELKESGLLDTNKPSE